MLENQEYWCIYLIFEAICFLQTETHLSTSFDVYPVLRAKRSMCTDVNSSVLCIFTQLVMIEAIFGYVTWDLEGLYVVWGFWVWFLPFDLSFGLIDWWYVGFTISLLYARSHRFIWSDDRPVIFCSRSIWCGSRWGPFWSAHDWIISTVGLVDFWCLVALP